MHANVCLTEEIFKLLSFGGLGIWAFIDIILVGIGYITPGDGSVYAGKFVLCALFLSAHAQE